MPTLKKRINITLPKDLEEQLEFIAERDSEPKSTKVVNLLRVAMEIEEDDILNEIASSRDNKNSEFINHEDAWI